jgi:anthranilate phosphoribosyltransferase
LRDAVPVAEDAIDSGRAERTLEALVRCSNEE